jgi:hypothetical protein
MSDEQETKPMHWLKLTLLGWLVHVTLAGGMLSRIGTVGPRYDARYREYNLLLPWMTEKLLGATRVQGSGPSLGLFAALALVDLAILACLARWERPMWHWWFWGVLVLLLLGWPVVEVILFLPEWKLREALSR